MNLEAQIEAVLFYKTEPVKKSQLADIFAVSLQEIDESLEKLTQQLISRGISIVTTDTAAQLVTAPEMSATIELIRKDELKSDIGKAGAETLAIILYKGPLSRLELDKIRGVNSSFIIRNLLIRGLIERRTHPTDSRSFTYAVTIDLLNHLGIQHKEKLPDYDHVLNALDLFEKQSNDELSEVTSV